MTVELKQKVQNELEKEKINYEVDGYGNIIVARKHRRKMQELGWSFDHKRKSWEKAYPMTKDSEEIAKLFA